MCLEYKPYKTAKKYQADCKFKLSKKLIFKRFLAIKENNEVSQSPLQRKTKPLRFEHFNNKEMKNTIGMWKIESSVFFRGGEVTWASHIKFRNLRSLYFYLFPLIINYTNAALACTWQSNL